MKITDIQSLNDLKSKLKADSRNYLLLYKEKTGLEDCAYTNLEKAETGKAKANVLAADVNKVKDIHPEYSIKTVPSLLIFDGEKYQSSVKGCNTPEYYQSLFEQALYTASAEKDEKPKLNITVYSTPTCTYCNQLKSYLKEHKISFRDIDVSKDPKAAEAMVKRSGQQGVPQTLINGKTIIGFDKAKIDKLVGLN
jgi:glutaredoxin-like YruB-family protein